MKSLFPSDALRDSPQVANVPTEPNVVSGAPNAIDEGFGMKCDAAGSRMRSERRASLSASCTITMPLSPPLTIHSSDGRSGLNARSRGKLRRSAAVAISVIVGDVFVPSGGARGAAGAAGGSSPPQ